MPLGCQFRKFCEGHDSCKSGRLSCTRCFYQHIYKAQPRFQGEPFRCLNYPAHQVVRGANRHSGSSQYVSQPLLPAVRLFLHVENCKTETVMPQEFLPFNGHYRNEK